MKKADNLIKGVNNSDSDISTYVALLKSAKMDFKIIKSNYSIELISPIWNVQLNTNERSVKFFQAQRKIISDLKERSELIGEIDGENNPRYFSVYNLRECEKRLIYAFDISGAYPATLHKMSLISDLTFDFLMNKIHKEDRLPAVGSIAGKKTIQYFYNGEFGDIEIKESEFRRVFFHLVHKVYECIDYVNQYFNYSYKRACLFSWVDCLYIDFTDFSEEQREVISYNITNEFLKLMYNIKIEVLKEFSCIEQKHYYKLDYIKKGKQTLHNVPKNEHPFDDKCHKILFGI